MISRQAIRWGSLGRLLLLCSSFALSADAQYLCPGDSVGKGDFRCASRVAPGGFSRGETPLFLLVTFDDGIGPFSESLIQPIVQDLKNPDGTHAPVTYFVTKANTVAALARQRYDDGNELANHTATHLTGTETTIEEWRQELTDVNRFLVNEVGLPSNAVSGFRAPNLLTNEAMWRALKELDFLYDSSLPELVTVPAHVSLGPDSLAWPHTLDYGSGLACAWSHCPEAPLPGMWSIPMWVLYDRDGMNYGAMDQAVASDSVFREILEFGFQQRYHGNKCPLGIYSHAGQLGLPGRRNVLRTFLQEKLALPDVWMITMRGLIEWMREPVPVSKLPDWFASGRHRGVGRPASSLPPAGRLVSPDSAANLTGGSVRLIWDVLLSASGYHLQVSESPDFSVMVLDTMGLVPAMFELKSIPRTGTYFWRVNGLNTGGAGPWSPVRSFFVRSLTAVPGPAPAPENYFLEQNYPNPFNPSTTISFTVPNPAHVVLTVVDPLGVEIASLVDAPLAAGRHTVVWNARDLASGVYFSLMRAGGVLRTRKMLLVH